MENTPIERKKEDLISITEDPTFQRRVHQIAYKLTGSTMEAEDYSQEALERFISAVKNKISIEEQECLPSIQTLAEALETVNERPPLGTPLLVYRGHGDASTTGVWSPDRSSFALGDSGDGVQVPDDNTYMSLWARDEHVSRVNALAWSPDGACLASGSSDQSVQIWDAISGRSLLTYRSHAGWVQALAWSPDGTRLASGANDQTVQIWQAV